MKLDHVLVVRPGALGDAVLTLPVLHALRQAGAKRITLLGTPANWAFLPRSHPSVEVLDFGGTEWLGLFADSPDTALFGTRSQALLRETDLSLVFLRNAHPAPFERFGARQTLVHAPPTGQDQDGAHAAQRLLAALNGHLPPEILARSMKNIDIEHWLQPKTGVHGAEHDCFALHPGSGGRHKCWPVANYIQLARVLARTAPVCVLSGCADADLQREFQAALPPSGRIQYVQRELRDVLALLAGARGYAGNDSGVSHLAARVCPSTVLFGPTNPDVWRPLGPDVRILRAPDGKMESIEMECVLESLLR